MWVWPGLRLVGVGGRVKNGAFASVASVSPDGDVTLESSTILTAPQAVRTLRLFWAITYAGCQCLTLHGIVRLDFTDHPFHI